MKKLLITLMIPGAVMACPEHTKTIKTPSGQTAYTVKDRDVYLPNGQRVAKIDSSGNIYSTAGSSGTPAGQRIGQVRR
jgi:hypothetical protein